MYSTNRAGSFFTTDEPAYSASSGLRYVLMRRGLFAVVVGATLALFGGTYRVRSILLSESASAETAMAATTSAAPIRLPSDGVSSLPTAGEGSATLIPFQHDASATVQAVLDAWVAAHPQNTWRVAVRGMGEDVTKASVRPDEVAELASVYKLLMVYPLLQKVPRSQWGTTTITVLDKPRTLTECVEAMLVKSDNDCGEAVAGYVGWVKGNKKLETLGLKNTRLDRGTQASVGDVATYLGLLYTGKLMSDDDRTYIMGLLKRQVYRYALPKSCSDCTVFDKTGDNRIDRNDVGIIEYGEGKAYVLGILTNGASYADIAQLAKQVNTAIVY